LFAKDFTENSVFGWQFPASYYQSVNPLDSCSGPALCVAMGPMGQKAAVEPR